MNRLVWSAMNTLPGPEATSVVLEWLENKSTDKKPTIPSKINDILSESELHMKMLRVYAQRVLQLKASQCAVISNGKTFGPLKDNEVFAVDDYALIERLHSFLHGNKIREALKKYDDLEESDSMSTEDSDLIMKLVGLLAPRPSKTRSTIPTTIRDAHTVVTLPPKQNNLPYIEVFAALDPGKHFLTYISHFAHTKCMKCEVLLWRLNFDFDLFYTASRGAQKLAPILILLRNVVNCNMRVVLSVVEKHSDMPVKK